MAKQSKAPARVNEPKPLHDPKTPAVDEEQLLEIPALSSMVDPGEMIQAYADRLSDRRFPEVQRQQLAAQIGEQMGNLYLQRVMDAVAGKKPPEPPAGITVQPEFVPAQGPDVSTAFKLNGNQAQLVQRMPFAVHIARAEEEEDQGEESLHIPLVRPNRQIEGIEDAIRSRLRMTTQVRRGADVSGLFGFATAEAELIDSHVDPAGGHYALTGLVEWRIFWDVQPSRGPQGQVDISSPEDPDISAANYDQVVADLTPDTSVEGGTPPRSQFWARDLTIEHEQYHVNDYRRLGQEAIRVTNRWLSGQTASSTREVEDLLPLAMDEFIDHVERGMVKPASEIRAYSAGVARYQARVEAIDNRGTEGRYGHYVTRGDTLSSIAQWYYGDRRRWRDIYRANRDQIPDPNHIVVGQTLVIPQ